MQHRLPWPCGTPGSPAGPGERAAARASAPQPG